MQKIWLVRKMHDVVEDQKIALYNLLADHYEIWYEMIGHVKKLNAP